MKHIENLKKHVFVCVNERESGDCCKNVDGLAIFLELKQFVREAGLSSTVWVTKTGCLGFCNDTGATVVVYPDKKWFLQTTMETAEDIKKYISQGENL